MNIFLGPRQNDRRDSTARQRLLQRIRSEFAEMPGLKLTRDQAMRLWSLPAETCDRIFAELERSGFLRRLDSGAYGRPNLGG